MEVGVCGAPKLERIDLAVLPQNEPWVSDSSRGVQHLSHTARNEAIAKGWKG